MTAPLRILVPLLAVLAMLAFARPAAADDDKATLAARKHFAKGEKLYALGRFDAALVEYEAAFEAKPLPGFLFNIGQCHRNLGNFDSAIFSFRKYLELQPEADNREAVLELIDELEHQKESAEAEQRRQQLEAPPKPPPKRSSRFYTKWWFWGGVAVAAGAGAGTYLLLRDSGTPDSDLGNVVFR